MGLPSGCLCINHVSGAPATWLQHFLMGFDTPIPWGGWAPGRCCCTDLTVLADLTRMIHILDTEHPWDVHSIRSEHSEAITCLEWDQSGEGSPHPECQGYLLCLPGLGPGLRAGT